MIIKCKYCHSDIGYYDPSSSYEENDLSYCGQSKIYSSFRYLNFVCLNCDVTFSYVTNLNTIDLMYYKIFLDAGNDIIVDTSNKTMRVSPITNGFAINLPYELSSLNVRDIRNKIDKLLIFS